MPFMFRGMATAASRFSPLYDRVLVRRAAAQTKSAGGVLLPESAQEKLNQGEVVAVGPGGRTSEGKTLQLAVKVGDKVILPDYGGTQIKLDGSEDFLLFRDSDLLGILKPKA
eukprot:TRINITY_DN8176_c0_g1_i7.p1 TRINITY_DN8176_c0_g1~~TRINITY_DN8176_c0_g1_i7.p1  ORF type:complete len:112 (+),score=18.00 TRINITY_DN8176_c0_g1_i7:96-431(+)